MIDPKLIDYRVLRVEGASPSGSRVMNPPANAGDPSSIPGSGKSPGQENPLEEGMATHSRILAWRIPWTEEPGGLQSMGSQSWTRLKRLSTHMCY